jgi:outer membrane protein OmpA-like peptidoglycan-associated protein/tetratricopeptide (TPR) repeat protein
MKGLYLLITALFLGSALSAQNVDFKRSNFKDKSDEFKSAKEALDRGEEFFKVAFDAVFEVRDPGLNFKKALQQFLIAQELNPDNALNNFRIGVSHYHSSNPHKAYLFLKRAIELDEGCDPFLPYYYGASLQLKGEFDKAITYFKKFEDGYKKSDNFSRFVSLRRNECQNAKKAMASPQRVWVDNVAEVNSEYDEIAPSITMDGSEIIFSSNRPNKNKPNEVSDYDHEIFSSYFKDGVWQSPEPLKGAVNSKEDDIVNNLSYDGTRLLLHKNNDGQLDIFESTLQGANWSAPEILSRQISSPRANEVYGSYNHDGYNIYFSRDSETRSNGFNIMFSGMRNKMEKNFGAATMVSEVNSRFNDGPVYLHIDGETMYLASQGHESLGGYDIFVSKRVQGAWTKPVNLGYPINTPYDDFFFAATANGKYAYISSNREGGKGGYDIYKVTFWGPPKLPLFDVEDYLLASIAMPIKDPQIEQKVEINKVSLTVFKGNTIDAISRKPVQANIVITDNKTGKIVERLETNAATGKFLLSLNAGANYGIAVEAKGYLFHSENFDIPTGSEYNLVNKEIELKNIAVGSTIQLRNIFFDVGKSTLRAESNAELDRLVALLNDVKSLKIEISGHTDNTGSASFNDKLSQERADAVVRYLTSKGIAANRLTAKGYGSSKPIADNNSAMGRQENRRTEFKIVGN